MTPVQTLSKALAVNSVLTSFASTIPRNTRPSGMALLNGEETLEVFPYAIGADNNTLLFRVVGWRRLGFGSSGLWIPTNIVEATGTISSTQIGIALSDVLETEMFADTIVVGAGIGVTPTQTSNAGTASLICDVSGFEIVQFSAHNNSSSTSVNALLCAYTGKIQVVP